MAKKFMYAFLLFILNLFSMFLFLKYIYPFPKGEGFAYVVHPLAMMAVGFISAVLYFFWTRKKPTFSFIGFLLWYIIFLVLMFLIRIS
ncbi:MAG: hypothetical protein KDC05_08665 [Bacteroidales bacterium]|nr:hypothetical protein [Bacteroidales bacterium]